MTFPCQFASEEYRRVLSTQNYLKRFIAAFEVVFRVAFLGDDMIHLESVAMNWRNRDSKYL